MNATFKYTYKPSARRIANLPKVKVFVNKIISFTKHLYYKVQNRTKKKIILGIVYIAKYPGFINIALYSHLFLLCMPKIAKNVTSSYENY